MPIEEVPRLQSSSDLPIEERVRAIEDAWARWRRNWAYIQENFDSDNVKRLFTDRTVFRSEDGRTAISGPRLSMYGGDTSVERLSLGYSTVPGSSGFRFSLKNASGNETVGIDSSGDAVFKGTIQAGSVIVSEATSDVLADINTALETASTAYGTATTALSQAQFAQATADGKIVTYYGTTAPTGSAVGDLWIDTDDGNNLYRWNGTSWVDIADAGIAQALSDAANAQATASTALTQAQTAQATADGKVVTFYSSTAPTAEAVGDLWVDTDDDNNLYRWSGSAWVDIHDGGIDAALHHAVGAEAVAVLKNVTMRSATAPYTLNFSRPSVAYKLDGTQVSANEPRYETGATGFGQAVTVEKGTVNLVTNPFFNDLVGWNAYTNGAISAVAAIRYGTGACRLTLTANGATRLYSSNTVNLTGGVTYVGSALISTSGGLGINQLYILSAIGAGRLSGTLLANTDLGGGLHLVVYSFAPATDTVGNLGVLTAIGTIGQYMTVDALQLEAKSYATSFTDGTRSPEVLTALKAGVFSDAEGSVQKRIYSFRNYGTNHQFVFDGGGAANQNLQVYISSATGKPTLVYGTGSTTRTITSSGAAISKETWYDIGWKWGSDGVTLFVNGANVGSDSTPPGLVLGDTVYWGSDASGANQLDGLLDESRDSLHARTDADFAADHASGAPLTFDKWTRLLAHFDGDLSVTAGAAGDVWIDTDDNKMNRWGGSSWTATPFGPGALSVSQLSAISADMGTVTAGSITGSTISGSYITGSTIQGGQITGSTVTGGTISGSTIVGGVIKSDDGRTKIQGNTLTMYGASTAQEQLTMGYDASTGAFKFILRDAAGNPTVAISGAGKAEFSGTVTATTMTGLLTGSSITASHITASTIIGGYIQGSTISGGYITGSTIQGAVTRTGSTGLYIRLSSNSLQSHWDTSGYSRKHGWCLEGQYGVLQRYVLGSTFGSIGTNTSEGGLLIADQNLIKIRSSSGINFVGNIGFYGTTAKAQQSVPLLSTAATLGQTIDKLNAFINALKAYGLIS